MIPHTWNRRFLVGLMVVIGGALPLVAYWFSLGRVPTLMPDDARELLGKPGSTAVLIDVRASEEFKANHLEAAENWPYDEVMKMPLRGPSSEIPERFKGKTLLLICNAGVHSALATARLHKSGLLNVFNVRGGMQGWVAGGGKPCPVSLVTLRAASGETAPLPFHELTRYEQWVVVFSGIGVKTTYMALALVLVGVLWRRRAPDLVALRWAFVFFFVGEAFCAGNYLLFNDQSYLFEYSHSFGMVLSFAFVTFAFFEGLDNRIIKYGDPSQKCAALGLCRSCIKYTDAPCGLKRLFLFLAPAGIILAFIPLTAEPHSVSFNTRIFRTLYNYSHPVVYQMYEIRWCPWFAILLFAITFLILLFKRNDPVTPSKVFFAAAMGYLGFSFFRLFLYVPYRDNFIWFVFWEEITELIFVVGALFVLWAFRHGLFAQEATASNESHATA